jgi:hypothetical protein
MRLIAGEESNARRNPEQLCGLAPEPHKRIVLHIELSVLVISNQLSVISKLPTWVLAED